MTLTPSDLTKIAALVIFVIVLGSRDDPRAWNWVKTQWSKHAWRIAYPYWWAQEEITYRRMLKTLNRRRPGWHNFRVR